MNGRRLFDWIFICDRRFVATTLLAILVLGSCAPQDNSITAALQSASDWLNNVPPQPPTPQWRLRTLPGQDRAPYPKLGDVPPRPSDLPTPASVSATVTALQANNADAGQVNADRPDAMALGGPPPARIEPLLIPGVGVVGRP